MFAGILATSLGIYLQGIFYWLLFLRVGVTVSLMAIKGIIYECAFMYSFHDSVNSILFLLARSRHRRCSTQKNVFKNYIKFAGKHMSLSLFFN